MHLTVIFKNSFVSLISRIISPMYSRYRKKKETSLFILIQIIDKLKTPLIDAILRKILKHQMEEDNNR